MSRKLETVNIGELSVSANIFLPAHLPYPSVPATTLPARHGTQF